MVGSTRDFKPAGYMLRNLSGYHVPSDFLLLEDAQSIQIKNILVLWQYAALMSLQ